MDRRVFPQHLFHSVDIFYAVKVQWMQPCFLPLTCCTNMIAMPMCHNDIIGNRAKLLNQCAGIKGTAATVNHKSSFFAAKDKKACHSVLIYRISMVCDFCHDRIIQQHVITFFQPLIQFNDFMRIRVSCETPYKGPLKYLLCRKRVMRRVFNAGKAQMIFSIFIFHIRDIML